MTLRESITGLAKHIVKGMDRYQATGVHVLDLQVEPIKISTLFAFEPFGGKEPRIHWARLNELPEVVPAYKPDPDACIVRQQFQIDRVLAELDTITDPLEALLEAFGQVLAKDIDTRYGPLTDDMIVLEGKPMAVEDCGFDPAFRVLHNFVLDWPMKIGTRKG